MSAEPKIEALHELQEPKVYLIENLDEIRPNLERITRQASENAERLLSAEDWTVSTENDYSVSPARRAFLSDPDLQHFLKTGEAPKYDIEPYLARVPNNIVWD